MAELWQVDWIGAHEMGPGGYWTSPVRMQGATRREACAHMRAEILRDDAMLEPNERAPRLTRDVVLLRLAHGAIEPGEEVVLGVYAYRYRRVK